ncbi:MAG: hypothetical protein ABFD16_17150 [Thermoguttaceae bacterium]
MSIPAKAAIAASWAVWTALACVAVAECWAINRQTGLVAGAFAAVFVATITGIHLVGYRLYKQQGSGGPEPSPAGSSTFAPVVKSAILQQVVVGVLAALMLDGGLAARAAIVGIAAYWLTTGMIVVRRPTAPTTLDLVWIKFGFLLVFLAAIASFYLRVAVRSC